MRNCPARPKYRCVFSFYGGKSKLAHLYPPPRHNTIVEPFAGGAAYSLRYYEHEAWKIVQQYVPKEVKIGQKVSTLLPHDAPEGLIELCRAEANHGTQGARGCHDQITNIGAKCWPRILPRLEHWLPRIRHWRFTQLSYNELPNREATWFVDPPYNNAAGRRYRAQVPDYGALAKWARTRHGQVIVCENDTASWLPFHPLCPRRGLKSQYQVSSAVEAVWTTAT